MAAKKKATKATKKTVKKAPIAALKAPRVKAGLARLALADKKLTALEKVQHQLDKAREKAERKFYDAQERTDGQEDKMRETGLSILKAYLLASGWKYSKLGGIWSKKGFGGVSYIHDAANHQLLQDGLKFDNRKGFKPASLAKK